MVVFGLPDRLGFAIYKEMFCLPMISIGLLPCLLFGSLFFVPSDYTGILPVAKGMNGSAGNKWIYDTLTFYYLFLLGQVLLKHHLIGLSAPILFALKKHCRHTLQTQAVENPSQASYFWLFMVVALIYFLGFWEFSETANHNSRTYLARHGNEFGNFIFKIMTLLFVIEGLALFIVNRHFAKFFDDITL